MPIVIPKSLPAHDILARENIFVMSHARATRQDIRPIEIAIVNLMPTKVDTETQLMRLLGNSPLQVNVTLIYTKSYKSKNTAAAHLDRFYKSFDVIFTSGDKLEFDKSGDWTEVKCIKNGVPSQIVPKEIIDYVNTNYPNEKILQIERNSREYEIKLSNRWEIKFDKQFRVIDIDD